METVMKDLQTENGAWNSIDAACKDDGEGENFILKKLLSSRTLLLSGGVDSRCARQLTNHLLLLEADDPEAPVTLLMNSPGGSVSDGFSIYDMIRFVRPKVRIVCTGLCASIATVILAAPPDRKDRLTLPNTRFMIHQPLIPMSVFGPASDLEITANEILKTREKVNHVLAEATGQPFAKVDEDTQRDYWMTAEEAQEYGLVSGIIQNREALDAWK
jgi:ATP-dependent Clp protease, protease subunit